MTESTQIAIYQGVNIEQAAYMAAFSQPDGLQSIIAQITEQAQAQADGLDASTAASRKKLASIAYSVAQAKTGIDGEGKNLVAEAKAKIKVVDDNRKAVRDQLDQLRDTIRQPVTEFEEAEKAREAAIADAVSTLKMLASATGMDGTMLTAEQLRLRREQAKESLLSNVPQISAAAAATVNFLDAAIVSADERQRQQAEIERLQKEEATRKQADRDAAIAAAAAEQAKAAAEAKAKAEKEAAERARIEAEIRAEEAEKKAKEAAERAEAEKQAAVEAERQRLEAERQRQQQEADAKAAEEAARAADIENQRAVNRSILAEMIACGIPEAAAKAFLLKAVKGQIANLQINY